MLAVVRTGVGLWVTFRKWYAGYSGDAVTGPERPGIMPGSGSLPWHLMEYRRWREVIVGTALEAEG